MRVTVWIVSAGLIGLGCLVLSYLDVLPGGWTLRGWITPHGIRREREQRAHSEARMVQFESDNRTAVAPWVAFLGSSTIERFPLAERFPGRRTLNRGIGNESCGELLGRLEASLPPGPAGGFVVYAGSIDFRRGGATPGTLVERVERVLTRLQKLHPGAPQALVGLLSERNATPGFVEGWRAANRALRDLCGRRNVAYIDVDRPPITRSDGALADSCSVDDLHLNSEGYEHLARWILEDGGPVATRLGP